MVGGQYGDEGKGLISAYLAALYHAPIVARAGTGPGAEHGLFLTEKGPYLKTNQLPLGWIFNPDTQIRIGAGVAVNPKLLIQEMDRFDLHGRVKVDYLCPIVTAEHIAAEKESKKMAAIGSTFSGSGRCRADLVLRIAKLARDIPELQPYLTDVGNEVNQMAIDNVVIVESSQGTLLSLSSPDYPNVTSTNVTTAAVADQVRLNWQKLNRVTMVIKSIPSREGSGSLGSEELTMEQIKSRGLEETSSIEGVTRRKGSEINWGLLATAAEINGATGIALTFCEHFDPKVANVTEKSQITDKLWKLVERVERESGGVPVTLLNTGKRFSSIVPIHGETLDWEEIGERLKKYSP